MYTIIIIAALLATDYLRRTNRLLAYRTLSAIGTVAAIALIVASTKDPQWRDVTKEMFIALFIMTLLEVYLAGLRRFETRQKKVNQ